MLGLNSGLLGVRRVPTTGSASGIWAPNEQSLAQRAAIWPLTGSDPYFANVELLALFDGADGSTTFTDFSTNAIAPTTAGGPTLTTTYKKFGTASLTNGTGGVVYTNSELNLGAGDFTIEGWVYMTASSIANYGGILSAILDGGNGNAASLAVYNSNIIFRVGNNTPYLDYTAAYTINTWHHAAISRSGGSLRAFLDGVQVGATVTGDTTSLVNGRYACGATHPDNPARLGLYLTDGYIDSVRVTKGVGRYTANFTPPAEAFPTY